MLSPKNSEAPKMPSAASASLVRRPPDTPWRLIRVISAMMPPSPSLSARITSSTYLSVTTIVTAQKISEMIPKTLSVVAVTGMRVARVEDRLDGVERAGADVAEDDAEGADDQRRLGRAAHPRATGIGAPTRLASTPGQAAAPYTAKGRSTEKAGMMAAWNSALAIAFSIAFALTNGFHDAANAIATLVATRGARPGQAVVARRRLQHARRAAGRHRGRRHDRRDRHRRAAPRRSR